MVMHTYPLTILIGPTASGKSALALDVAKRRPTVIINADAMQMYEMLPIITARPDAHAMAAVEHQLYGVWAADNTGSVAQWLVLACAAIRAAWRAQKHPLLVGGTGMYIKALMEGLSVIPPVPEAVRTQVRNAYATQGVQALYAQLQKEDAVMAARLKAGDSQRIMRALEVVRTTGKSLALWQEDKGAPPLPDAQIALYAMRPKRAQLYARIDARFDAMMAQGALNEVAQFIARTPKANSPVAKACGVPELMAHLNGELPLDAAVSRAKQHSRNYAKRQMTWIRQQCANAQDACELES